MFLAGLVEDSAASGTRRSEFTSTSSSHGSSTISSQPSAHASRGAVGGRLRHFDRILRMDSETTGRVQRYLELLRKGCVASAVVCFDGDRPLARASVGHPEVDQAFENLLAELPNPVNGGGYTHDDASAPAAHVGLRESLPPGYRALAVLHGSICVIGVVPIEVD